MHLLKAAIFETEWQNTIAQAVKKNLQSKNTWLKLPLVFRILINNPFWEWSAFSNNDTFIHTKTQSYSP